MATKRRIAPDERALQTEIAERLKGLPAAYNDGDRVVPVAYNVEVEQLATDEDHSARDSDAYRALQMRAHGEINARATREANACLARLTHAQQSDDGVGLSFMTRSERALGSYEWGRRLRELVEAGKRRDVERERSRVLVDVQWDD